LSGTLRLTEIHDLAYRFVPPAAADRRLYDSGAHSWWPAHEIGHFLVATAEECHEPKFGLDVCATRGTSMYRYVVVKEIAATRISQRLLRRSEHADLADDEIQYTDENTLECSFEPWCKRAVHALLRTNKVTRLPTTPSRMERLLARKLREVALKSALAQPPTRRPCK
jgi:hypothetical protein